jgi:hypothetical protein
MVKLSHPQNPNQRKLVCYVGNTFEIFSWQHRWHDTQFSKLKQTSKQSIFFSNANVLPDLT